MSDDFKIRIAKLAADGSNWVTYRDRIMWALDAKGLLDHLTNGSITSDYVAAGTIDGQAPEARWKRDEAMVKQLVAGSVPDTVFSQIKAGLGAKEVWEQLRLLYEGRSKLILVDLRRKMQNTCCGPEDDVRAHFNKLAELKEQLAAMGHKITDEEYATILLGSLPDSYDSAMNSITAAADISGKAITPALVIRLVTDEYDRRSLKKAKGKSPSDEAFYANGQRRKGGRDIECFNCHRKGHMKADCWAKGGGKEGQRPQRFAGARANAKDSAAVATENVEVEAWAAIEATGPHAGNATTTDEQTISPIYAEIYDSGATRHMSPYKERFNNYRSISPRPITAADKRVFYTIGTGNLTIQVPNGGKCTPVILRDALHTPDMGLTVVSINRITAVGHKVLFTGNSCEIQQAGQAYTLPKIGIISGAENGT